jgi:threonine dehydratase
MNRPVKDAKDTSQSPAVIPTDEKRKAIFDRYLPHILKCRLEDLVSETPVQNMPRMSERLGVDVLVKREDLQPVFSFKLRGAYAKLQALDPTQCAGGVICASAGNHAQGVAFAARHMGISATVVMPAVTPDIKVDAVRKLGATVIIQGDDFEAACEHALQMSLDLGHEFIHPYDDAEVITGQATLGLELIRQVDQPLDYLFIPIGGGGLAAGVSLVARFLQPDIRLIGVEARESASMQAAMREGRPVTLEEVGHFAEGVSVKRVGDLSFEICSQMLDEVISVDSDEVCAAVQDVYEDTRAISEPAGALAFAGMRQYFHAHPDSSGRAAGILSGANVNFARLRHIAERAAVGEEQEALLGVGIPEQAGSFLDFCETVGARGITEFNYRFADQHQAQIFVGIALKNGIDEKQEIIEQLSAHGFPVTDLSSNNMARQHIRHMVGGRADVPDERLYQFEFPERAGALIKFLRGMKTAWNISLFHYRNYGAEYGRVLMGIQVPETDMDNFHQFLESIAYPYTSEGENIAYRLFVGPASG